MVYLKTIGMLFIKRLEIEKKQKQQQQQKNNTNGVLSKQAIYFYDHYYRFFRNYFGTHSTFGINRSSPGLC